MQKNQAKNLIPHEAIQSKIIVLRGKKVMIDRDLAMLYGVPTKVLNQAVKRNFERFPDNFMFQLNKEEKEQLVTNCDWFNTLKHSTVLPYAFTEYGVAMLSSVLNSKRAIQINIAIINAFVKMREMFEGFVAEWRFCACLPSAQVGHSEGVKRPKNPMVEQKKIGIIHLWLRMTRFLDSLFEGRATCPPLAEGEVKFWFNLLNLPLPPPQRRGK